MLLSEKTERKVVWRANQNPNITAGVIVGQQRNCGVNKIWKNYFTKKVKYSIFNTELIVLKKAGLETSFLMKSPVFEPLDLKPKLGFTESHIDRACLFGFFFLFSEETEVELFGHNFLLLTKIRGNFITQEHLSHCEALQE